MRRTFAKTGLLALVAVLALSGAMMPSCGAACCPLTPDGPALNATMPCCAEPSMNGRDNAPSQPATSPSFASKITVSLAVIALPSDSPVARHAPPVITAAHQHSAPLFLQNAQLLI